VNRNTLYEKVKEYVLDLKKSGYSRALTKESVAKKFKTKPHEIDHIFRKLNLEGVLKQPVKRRGDDRWTPDFYYFRSPHDSWFQAVQSKNKDKILEMLDKGMDINARDGWKSALKLSADHRYSGGIDLSFIRFLLENGADPTFNENPSDLFYVLNEKNTELLKLYLEFASSPYLENDDGENIFFVSCVLHPEHVPTLVDFGFEIDKKNNYGHTPLMNAVLNNQTETVRYLLTKGASVTKKDHNKKTAFTHALERDNVNIMKCFVPYVHKFSRQDKKNFKNVRLTLLF
jgi:ankyrin repeat protein